MAITASKLLAVVIAIAYFVTAVVVEKPRVSEAIMLLLGLLVPLALIWFGLGDGSIIFVEAEVEHRFYDIEEELEVLVFFAPAEQE